MVKVSTQLVIVLLLASTPLTAGLTAPQTKSPVKSTAGARKAAPAPSAGARRNQAGGPSASNSGSSAALNTYATQLREKMGSKWNYPTGKNHVTVTIQIAQDGSVINLSLASTPKNDEAEQKANDAFNSAQPLQALPAGITEAKIVAVFDSQADQWDSKGFVSVKIDPVKTEKPASEASTTTEPSAGKTEEPKPAGEDKK